MLTTKNSENTHKAVAYIRVSSQIRTPFASLVAKKLFIEGDEIENETLGNEGLYVWLGLILGVALGLTGLLYLGHLSNVNFVCGILCLVPFTTFLLILIFLDFEGEGGMNNDVILGTTRCKFCDVVIGTNKRYCKPCSERIYGNATSEFEFNEIPKFQSIGKPKTVLMYRCRSCNVKIGMYKHYCKSCRREQELDAERSFSRYSTKPRSDYIPRTQPIKNLQTKPISSTPNEKTIGVVGIAARVILLPVAIIGGIFLLGSSDNKTKGPP